MSGSEDPTRIHPTAPAPPAPTGAPPAGSPADGQRLTPHDPSPGGPRTPSDPPLPPTGGGGGGGDGWDDGPDEPDHTGRNRNWILAVGAGALVLIALFLGLSVLGNDDDDDGRTGATTPAEVAPSTPASTPAPAAETTPAEKPEPEESTDNGGSNSASGGTAIGGDDDVKPADDGPLLTAGSVTKLTANQGDTVTFQVKSDSDEEVHVHGYDLKYDIAAGETQTISFEATLTGIFEIEFEGSGTQIGELTVEP